MEEQRQGLVKASEVRLPKFVEDAYTSIEGMKAFANILLESKLVPDSYYEKGIDKKPDYTKGKTSAVVVVLLQAQQLNVPPMTALQHIVPVNGLLSIKGDLAKTMIFASGKLKKDSWKEEVMGSIEQNNMVVTITATRDDNGLTLSRSFSVDKAKRMGLWVTSTQVEGQDGWKWKNSAWYKTPERMIMYRALGFIARDLFSDVLLNMYTTEEAVDIVKETEEIIQTESGAKITIPDKKHSQERSEKMTERVAEKIKSPDFAPVQQTVMQPTVVNVSNEEGTINVPDPPERKDESPFIPGKGSVEVFNGEVINRRADVPMQYTLAEMEKMDTEALKKIVMDDMDMMEACEIIPGKNTNKKLREIIYSHQNGELEQYIKGIIPDYKGNAQKSEIPVNKDFDKQGAERAADDFLNAPSKSKEIVGTNKYGLPIPEFDKGEQRDFATTKQLFNMMAGLSPSLNNPRYLELAGKKGLLAAFPDREAFCKFATVKLINELLDSN